MLFGNKDFKKLQKENEALKKELNEIKHFYEDTGAISQNFTGKIYRWEYDYNTKLIKGTDLFYELAGIPINHEIKLDRFIELMTLYKYEPLLFRYLNFKPEYNNKIFEDTFVIPNGTKKTIRHSAKILTIDGKPSKLFGIVKFISTKKDTDSPIYESISNLIHEIEEVYLIIDRKTKVPIFISNNLFSQYKVPAEIFSQNILSTSQYVHRDDLEKFNEFNKKFDEGIEHEEIIRFKIKNKSWWLKLRSVHFKDQNTSTIIIKNVSDHYQTKKKLIESEHKYHQLINQLPFMYLIHKNAIIRYVNKKVIEVTGKKDIIGKNLFEITPKEFHETIEERLRLLKEGKDIEYPLLAKMLDKNGKMFPVKVHGEKIFYEGEWCNQLILEDISKEEEFKHIVKSEQIKFQKLIEVAPVITVMLDDKGTIQLINDKGAEIMGVPAEELIGKSWFQFIRDDLQEKCKNEFENAIKNKHKSIRIYENVVKSASGKNVLIEWHDTLIEDKETGSVYLLASGYNITARKLNEQKLKEQRSLLRLILDKVPSMLIYVSAKDNIIRHVNKPFSDFTGKSFQDLIGKNANEVFKNEKVLELRKQVKNSQGKQISTELNIKIPNKGKRTLNISLIPHLNEKGEITAYLSVIDDITDKRVIEDKLKESEKTLRLLINSSPDIICFKDAKGRWLMANDAYLELFKLQDIDYYGNTDTELAKYTDPVYKKTFEKLIQSDEKTWKARTLTRNEEIIPYEGENRIFDIIKVPIFYDNGKRQGLIVVGRDITEKRKTEKTIQESENKFRTLFNESDTPKMILSTDGKFIDCNDSAVKTLNYSDKSELIGKTPVDISPPFQDNNIDSKFLAQKYIDEAFEKGNSRFEWVHLTKDKQKRYFNISLTRITVNNENMLYVDWHDITERIKSNEENKKLFAAIEQSPISVLITDTDAKIEYANPYFSKVTGYDTKEIIGKNPRFLKSNLTPFHTYHQLWSNITQGKIWSGEFFNKKKNGDIYVESCSIIPIKDNNGKITNYVALKEDITDKRKAEEKLRESENKFKSLFYENESILLLFDPVTGKIIEANDAACRFYGYSHEEIINQVVFDFNTKPKEELVGLLDKIRNKEQNHFTFKHKLRNGEIKDVELYTGIIYNENNEMFYSIIHDISDQVKTKEELLKAKEHAEESDKLKSAFLANMSHEIRTPMNAILGFSSLLQDKDLTDEEKDQFISIINSSGYALLEIINDIIEMSKIEAGEISINKKETDIYELVSSVYRQQSFVKFNKDIDLKLVADENYPDLKIIIDPTKMRQILTNIVNNAIKFTDEGYVEMGYKVQENEILFYVKDTGIGIPEEKQEFVFDRFNKVSDNTSKIYPGTGLGLSISKAFVEKMGGKIYFESEKNVGTTFYISMPLETKNKIKPVKKKKTNDTISELLLKDKTILVAEDEIRNFQFLKIILTKLGAEVLYAPDGKEAVEITKELDGNIDIIFMDIKMPVMDGFKATELIREHYPDIIIIAQTAYAFVEDRTKSLDAGCNDYISKPIMKEKLIELLRNYV